MNDRKKILIASIAGGVLVLGGLGYLCYSDWETKKEVEQESEDLRGKITRAEAEVATVADVEQRVLVLRNRLKQHVAILPDDERINGFVDKLTEFAKLSGVSIESLDDSSARQLRSTRGKAKEAFERVTYKLDIRCNTDRFLRFLDLFENEYERFVRIPGFSIRPDSAARRNKDAEEGATELDLVASLTLETYVYNPKAKGYEQVPIRQEAAKVEKLRREGVLEEDSSGLEVASYDFTPKPERRDPFRDPRVAIGGEITAEARKEQQETLDDLKSRLRDILGKIALEQAEQNTVRRYVLTQEINVDVGKLSRDVLARAKDKYFTVREFAQEFHVEVEIPTAEIMKTRNVVDPVSLADVLSAVKQMEQHLSAGEYDKVLKLYGQLEEMKEIATNNEELAKAFRDADGIKAKAEAYREFAAKKIEIAGCIVFGGDEGRAVAIINDRSFSPGEVVEAGLVVKGITASEVSFSYKGVTVVRRYVDTGVAEK